MFTTCLVYDANNFMHAIEGAESFSIKTLGTQAVLILWDESEETGQHLGIFTNPAALIFRRREEP